MMKNRGVLEPNLDCDGPMWPDALSDSFAREGMNKCRPMDSPTSRVTADRWREGEVVGVQDAQRSRSAVRLNYMVQNRPCLSVCSWNNDWHQQCTSVFEVSSGDDSVRGTTWNTCLCSPRPAMEQGSEHRVPKQRRGSRHRSSDGSYRVSSTANLQDENIFSHVFQDATACKDMHLRKGAEKVKHLTTKQLWSYGALGDVPGEGREDFEERQFGGYDDACFAWRGALHGAQEDAFREVTTVSTEKSSLRRGAGVTSVPLQQEPLASSVGGRAQTHR